MIYQNKLMKIELSKYNFKAERKDIEAFLNSISGNNIEKLKNDFKNNQLDFELFVEEKETQFKWQKLIYSMYSNKIEIDKAAIEKEINEIFENKVEVEEYNISEIELLFNNLPAARTTPKADFRFRLITSWNSSSEIKCGGFKRIEPGKLTTPST